ncbi:unnamed protein product [Brassica oleracea var. botrytis]
MYAFSLLLVCLFVLSLRILCKFFAHGACLKGDNCEFSHDWKDPSNNICTFYQRGNCSYGSRCRYEHVKPSRPPHPSPASSSTYLSSAFVSERDLSSSPAWTLASLNDEVNNTDETKPEDQPICSYAAAGDCPRGDQCPHIHGDLCPTCQKHCLHPFRPEEREEHKRSCEKKHKQLEALKLSQDVECCVCLERVLSKPTPAERKFGILTECDHAFCIGCIRNWRSSAPSTGMDVNSTLRACPICRKLSYFVVPSVIWFSDPDEKKEIMDNYRDKLRSIDCKHFNFGDGNCPFGTSCFYKHAFHDGRLEEVVLRHLDAEDGQTVIAKDIRIEDVFTRFINLSNKERENALVFPDQDRRPDIQSKEYLLRILQQLKTENDIALQLTNPAAIKSDVEELEQEVCRLHQQLQMAEEELSRRYEPDPVRFTSMEDYEVCEKQLLDTLTHVVQRREYLVSSHLSSYETSTMQQGIAGPFANGVLEGWLPENGHNQVNLFDASAHSNQLRELPSAMYEPLMQGSSSSSNQNNMSECHVTNHNGDMFSEWAQAYSSSALFPSMNQHGSVGPSIEEMMPGQQSEIPAVTTMEAPQQAKLEVVDDYETRVPQLSSQ